MLFDHASSLLYRGVFIDCLLCLICQSNKASAQSDGSKPSKSTEETLVGGPETQGNSLMTFIYLCTSVRCFLVCMSSFKKEWDGVITLFVFVVGELYINIL